MRFQSISFLGFVCLIGTIWAQDVEEIRKKCQSADGLRSCGLCMKQNPDCAWCAEPTFQSLRCDHKSSLASTCPSAKSGSAKSELKIPDQNNYPMGFEHPHYKLPVQITPQQVYLRLKPGDSIDVSFTYKHIRPAVEVQDFSLTTSDLDPIGLKIDFEIECHGRNVRGKICQGVKEGDEITFIASVSLKECKTGGDVAASIGVYGYSMVSAVFVTPLCACECEKVKNTGPYDRHCNMAGRLVCGQCACEKGYGGPNCQCDLNKYGATTAEDLENKCRRGPDELVCSGKGSCNCGKCTCKANFIQGQFCECDATSCPKDRDGRLCSGRGVCNCGECECDEGFDGDDCGCTSDEAPCRENGQVCSDNGKCSCGRCACKDGFTGAFCSIEQPSDAKDGQTLNGNDFVKEEDSNDNKDSGAILPDDDTSEEKDQAVEKGEPQEQDSGSSSVLSMNALLSTLLGLLIVKLGLILS